MSPGAAKSSMAPASLLRRLAALAYESLIAGALLLALGFALLPLTAPAGHAASELGLMTPSARAGSFACLFTLFGAYCVWLWTGGRRSLPMKAWHLALRTADGVAPSVTQAMLRYLGWWIGPALAIGAWIALRPHGHQRWALAALAVNYAWALFDSGRQFLHDRLAGTRIVRA